MDNLFIPGKLPYVKGDRPAVDCILCGIVQQDERVVSLEIFRSDHFMVTANLFPYNPGHLMVFPLRHLADPAELTEHEVLELHRLQVKSMRVLHQLYGPRGFNWGCNIGETSGASIKHHLHLHLVPRYPGELGFIDIIGGARVIVEEPNETVRRLKEAFAADG